MGAGSQRGGRGGRRVVGAGAGRGFGTGRGATLAARRARRRIQSAAAQVTPSTSISASAALPLFGVIHISLINFVTIIINYIIIYIDMSSLSKQRRLSHFK